MDTPAQRFQKKFKESFEKFLKTPFAIPAAVGLSAVVYTLALLYLAGSCLSNLVTPLAMLGIFWYFGIKSIKKLLIVGVASCLVFSGIFTAFYTDIYSSAEQMSARSEDYVLEDGMVTPFKGDSETIYNYTITVHLPSNSSTVTNMTVWIGSLDFPYGTGGNYSMTLYAHDDATNTSYYSYETQLPQPVNVFGFWARIDGAWHVAMVYEDNQKYWPLGPIYENSWSIVGLLIPVSILTTLTSVFLVYGLLVFMVWWTRRARDMRLKAYEKAAVQREEQMKDLPSKEEAKVPSLAVATGAAAEGAFVCSECGADVPAEATVCPKCGEKFD